MGIELVATAKDGLDAKEKIEEFMPDIVITDLKMPNMDGIELIHWCTQLNLYIKFVVISSYDDFHMAKQVFKLGVKEYFLKAEIIPEELEKTVRTLIREIEDEKEKTGKDKDEKILQNDKKMDILNDEQADIVTLVQKYVNSNYHKELSLFVVASDFNINYSTLSRLFNRKIGKSFIAYLTEMRMNAAVKLMKTTDYKLYEIAEMVGYSNYEHFSRVFKKTYGKWPKKF